MNENFSIMCYLLVKSLSANAGFPGRWKVVFSVSRDSVLTPSSPQFAWCSEFPVEFQDVDRDLWDEMHYAGTGTKCIISKHSSDLILYIDADVVIRSSLDELLQRVLKRKAVFGWPAWFSADTAFDTIFKAAGIDDSIEYSLQLTADGADVTHPGWPKYLNFGFIALRKDLANEMRATFPADQAFVMNNFDNYFAGQVALSLNLVKNNYDVEPIDECYNAGSDHPVALAHYEKKLGRPMFPSRIAIEEPKVLHYCFPTPTLKKRVDMANWSSLRCFLERSGLQGFEKHLQETILNLGITDSSDAYLRCYYQSQTACLAKQLAVLERSHSIEVSQLQSLLSSSLEREQQANKSAQKLEKTIRAYERSLGLLFKLIAKSILQTIRLISRLYLTYH